MAIARDCEPRAPLVTVIIAAYNSSGTLAYTLRSLLNQDFSNFEAWVIGDACSDDSEQIVAQCNDERLHWFNLKQHVGFQSGPNNEGLRRARGKYIAYLGHDDLWFPMHLSGLISTIERDKADFVHAVAAMVGPEGVYGGMGNPGVERPYSSRGVPPSTWLHRRDVIDDCGGWPVQRVVEAGFACDFAYQRRLFLSGKRFATYDQLTVIKFPSPKWRLYAARSRYPQRDYMEMLEKNATRLQLQLYKEIAYAYGREHENVFVRPALLTAKSAIYRAFKDWYGADRWPLKQVLNWRGRWLLKLNDRHRGLASTKDP